MQQGSNPPVFQDLHSVSNSRALVFFVIFSAVILAMMAQLIKIIYESNKAEIIARVSERELAKLALVQDEITNHRKWYRETVNVLRDDIRLFIGSADDNGIWRLKSEQVQRAEELILSRLEVTPDLFQIRIFDAKGQELLRANKRTGSARLVPDTQLQNLAGTDLFAGAITMPDGAIRGMGPGLFTEAGNVVFPSIPVNELSLPLGPPGPDRKVLAVNFDLREVRTKLESQVLDGQVSDFYVMRPDGVFLIGGSQFRDHEYGDERGVAFQSASSALPELWRAAGVNNSGYILSDVSLTVYRSVVMNNSPERAGGGVSAVVLPVDTLFTDLPLNRPLVRWLFGLVALGALLLVWFFWSLATTRQQFLKTLKLQDRVFSIVAHELRIPAATIQMMANNVKSRSVDPRDLQSVASHLLSVIDDLRVAIDPEVLDAVQENPFSLYTLVSQVGQQMTPLFLQAQMDFEVEPPDWPDGYYLGDVYRLRAVLTSILRNARFHSHGSKVVLRVNKEIEDDRFDLILITIEDDGVGVPEEHRGSLFESFTRGVGKVKGTGLGLNIVRESVELMGGTVDYRASSLGGARFDVRLSLEKSVYGAMSKSLLRTPNRAIVFDHRLSVLLIEDDPLMQRLTLEFLSDKYEFDVLAKSSAAEALAVVEERRFDLIVLDWFLPMQGGNDFLETLRETDLATPVIVLTAVPFGRDSDKLYSAGVDVIVTKPINEGLLNDALQTLRDKGKLNF